MKADDVRPFEDSAPGEIPVRGYLHVPANPSGDGLVLTHGAGSNCQAPLLIALATRLCELGMTVLRCDLPFRQLRPQGPPRGGAERDQQGLRRAVDVLRGKLAGEVFLGGHSYGGRQASMLAASAPGLVDALLLLSYPLHPPKRPYQPRTSHWPDLRTAALFVHGARDGFGSIAEMTVGLKLIPAPTRLLAIEGAGHELMAARNRAELPSTIGDAFTQFIRSSAE